jgi:hypothetical protein
MRRLVGFTVLVAALAVPALGLAVTNLSDDGYLSVKNGVGKVSLTPFNGSAIGKVARGSIRIIDPIAGDTGSYDVWGCDNQTGLNDHITVCSGTNLRFRIVDGRYKLFMRGSGINVSVVGRGQVSLDGAGDSPDVGNDGVYALNDAPYRSLPDSEKTLPLVGSFGG